MIAIGRCKICILFSMRFVCSQRADFFFVMSAEEVKEHQFVTNPFSRLIA